MTGKAAYECENHANQHRQSSPSDWPQKMHSPPS